MTDQSSPALQVALAYYNAWKSLDHATAMKVVADEVVSETPFGDIEGGAALHQSELQFAGMLTGATLVEAFGHETTALLMYYTHTHPAPSVLSAKYFTVENGKITSMKAVYDKSAFTGS